LSIPFEITDRLHKQGLIDEPRSHRKSICLTDEGLERAKAAFEALCGDRDANQGSRA
jgi:DNA-binding transcriptional regulator PaaX